MKELIGYQRGINLGGWFSQCDNTEERYDRFITKEDFHVISRWGLDHVRIPIDYELLQNPDGSFKPQGFQRIDRCLLWAEEYGLKVVLDLHKTMGFSFDEKEGETGFFESSGYQDCFYALWQELARRFGERENVAFELLNEVTDGKYRDSWNTIACKCVEKIRKIAKKTLVIIGGCNYNNVSCVRDIAVPPGGNIAFNFHLYDPLVFTHQGAYWLKDMDVNFRMGFDEPGEKYLEYSRKYLGAGHLWNVDKGSLMCEEYFDALVSDAVAAAERAGVPLYCGEYGVIDRADPQEGLKWLRCVSAVFRKNSIGRALWTYRQMDFGLADPHYDDVREEMIKLL